MRDIVLEETIYLDFTTRAFASGVPTVLAGTPVLSVLEENNATPITAGVSVSVDRASVVGLNMATVVATAANGYEDGKGYSVYISTGTVGGVSVIGEVVAQFTIGASAAAQDLANGTDGLGAIKTETALIVADTNELQSDDVPGLIATLDAVVDTVKAETVLILADTADMQPRVVAIETDTGTTLQGELDAIQAAVITNAAGVDIAADIIAMKAETVLIVADTNELQSDDVPGLIATLDAVVDTVKAETVLILADTADIQPNYATSTALATVDTVVDGIQTDLSNGTDGLGAIKTDTAAILADTADIQPNYATSTALATVDTVVDAILVDTAEIGAAGAGLTAVLTTQMTESYAADGTAPTLAQAVFLIQQTIGDFAIAGTTITVKQLDGSTTAATYTLDDSTAPTSRTRST